MKILLKDLKHGKVKVSVEASDDLWYLYTLVDEGDICVGESEYKYKIEGGAGNAKVVKKRVWVAIKVIKTEFSQHTGQLRVSGTVVDGSEEVPRGSHHTLDVEENYRLEIGKERWMDYHLEKLDEAAQGSGLKTLLVLFDREQAVFALLRPQGHEKLLELKGDVPKKGIDEGKTGSFYREIALKIEDYAQRMGLQRIVAASPGFWKEYLRKELPQSVAGKVVFASVSSADESAIGELLRSPELARTLEGERSAREIALVDAALEALGKDRLVYGLDDLERAVGEGNLATLLVTERTVMRMREEGTFARLEALMRAGSGVGAKVHLLSTEEAMRKIDALSGCAGARRW